MKGGGGDRRSPPKLRGGVGNSGSAAALGRNSRPVSGGSSSSKDGDGSMQGGNMAAGGHRAMEGVLKETLSADAVMQSVEQWMAGEGDGREIYTAAGVKELGSKELGRKARFIHGENSAMEEEASLHGAVHVDERVGGILQGNLLSNNNSMLLEDQPDGFNGNREGASEEEIPLETPHEQPGNEGMHVDTRHNAVPDLGYRNNNSAQDVRQNATMSGQGQFSHMQAKTMNAVHRNSSNNAWQRPSVVPLPARCDLGDFISENKIVQLDESVLETNIKRFEAALVGRLFGRKFPFNHLNSELQRRWNGFGQFRLMTTSADSFVCFFDNADIRDAVLMGGPWTIAGQVLGLDRWSPSFSPSSEDGFITPVWVRLPGLPLYCWDATSIARITGFLGEPLWIDAATDRMERGSFARACVKINLARPLEPGIWVQSSRGRFFQPAEYEGLSTFCFKCGHVGHRAVSCSVAGAVDVDAAQPHPKDGATNKMPTQPTVPNEGEEVSAPLSGSTDSSINNQQRGLGPWMIVTRKKRPPPRGSGTASGGIFTSKHSQGNRQEGSQTAGARNFSNNAKVQATGPRTKTAGNSQGENIWQSKNMSWSPPKTPWRPLEKQSNISTVESIPQDELNATEDSEFPGFSFGASSQEQNKGTSGNKDRLSKAHIERMKSHLGPLAYGSRKKRKQPPQNDGGDASPLVN